MTERLGDPNENFINPNELLRNVRVLFESMDSLASVETKFTLKQLEIVARIRELVERMESEDARDLGQNDLAFLNSLYQELTNSLKR